MELWNISCHLQKRSRDEFSSLGNKHLICHQTDIGCLSKIVICRLKMKLKQEAAADSYECFLLLVKVNFWIQNHRNHSKKQFVWALSVLTCNNYLQFRLDYRSRTVNKQGNDNPELSTDTKGGRLYWNQLTSWFSIFAVLTEVIGCLFTQPPLDCNTPAIENCHYPFFKRK